MFKKKNSLHYIAYFNIFVWSWMGYSLHPSISEFSMTGVGSGRIYLVSEAQNKMEIIIGLLRQFTAVCIKIIVFGMTESGSYWNGKC